MISIIIDTNILFSKELDFNKVFFADKLIELIEEIESNDLYETVRLLIPQIVLDELYTQQIEKYEEVLEKIKNVKFPNFDIVHNKEYKNELKELFSKKIISLSKGLVKIVVLPYPENDSLLQIIQRAIEKKAPFEAKSKESDKGFKDVILWETLLQFKRRNATDTLLLFSADGRLCEKSLEDEYRLSFNDIVHLIKRNSQSGNNELFLCIQKVQGTEFTPLFSNQLNERLLNSISETNLIDLFTYDEIVVDGETYLFISLTIFDKEIKNITNEIENDRISFFVTIRVNCQFDKKENNISQQLEPVQMYINSDMEFDYSFKDDSFYLRQYDALGKGRVVFTSTDRKL